MKKLFLISGSLAYDTIVLNCEDLNHPKYNEFQMELLKDEVDIVEHFGGTGGNIVFNSNGILNANGILVTSVGKDFNNYEEHLVKNKINLSNIFRDENDDTARVIVLNGKNGDQKSFFYPGASKRQYVLNDDLLKDSMFVHLAPDAIEATISIGEQLISKKKKYFLDPGQSMNDLISQEDIFKKLIKKSSALFVNEKESEMLEDFMKTKLNEMFYEETEFIVKTLGSKGVELFFDKGRQSIKLDVCKPVRVVDPTGCGDAFRGGFLSAYSLGSDLEACVRMGNVMGSFAIEKEGGQNHNPNLDEIKTRVELSYAKQNVKNKF